MKVARLPTGELMEFPPDFPDDEMDRQVRAKLGVPESVDPDDVLKQTLDMVAQQLGQIQMAQQRNDQALSQAVGMMAQALDAMASSQTQQMAALQQGFAALEAAYRAPRQIVTDSNGKPLGFRTGGNA